MNALISGRFGARRVVMASRGPGMKRKGGAFPPYPREDLVFRGGRTIADLTYKTFYLGKAWGSAPLQTSPQSLDAALAAAMSDKALNEIAGQYFASETITTTAAPSAILDLPLQSTYDKDDIHTLAQRVFESGALAGLDLKNTVFNFILPPGAVLSSDTRAGNLQRAARKAKPGTPEAEEEDSKHGLGGYHGSVHLKGPGGSITVYYAAAVWSDGQNGIPIPGWAPWENACATLYHELNEARTDPDVEDAIRTGDLRWIGWNSNSGQEIGDFPIEEAGPDLPTVFKKVDVDSGPGTAPIQLLWSNRVHGPEEPSRAQVAMNAAAPTGLQVINLMGAAAGPAQPIGAGIILLPPGGQQDFTKPDSGKKWSDTLSSLFDDAVAATQTYLKGSPSQFFNPAAGIPSGQPAELPIKWPGFPRLLENSGLPVEEQYRRAEVITLTMLGRYQHQDEYLEWYVHRDSTQKITRIDFTCEGPEYWEFLAQNEAKVLLALYQKHVDPAVKASDLMAGGQYNPLNVWNTRKGAMHLIQPNNTLGAEIRIAGDATILRKNPDGSLKTDAQDLINCARYGVAGRASDPHIGDLVNGLARDGYAISIKDPVGLYISRPRLLGCTTPDGAAITQEWFQIARGSETSILRGVFQAPAGSQYVVGDVQIGGDSVRYGGQIAKLIDMGLVGVAYNKGSISSPAFPCESDSSLALMSALAVHRDRTRTAGQQL